jgi:hypothetical protein
MVGSNYQQFYEDQVIATSGGTYATGGIKVTVTKCSQLLPGTLQTQTLGAGFIATPVSASELGGAATVQFWGSNGAAPAALAEMANSSTSAIGLKVRLAYVGV